MKADPDLLLLLIIIIIIIMYYCYYQIWGMEAGGRTEIFVKFTKVPHPPG